VCAVVAVGLAATGGGGLSWSRDGSLIALAGLGTTALIGGGSLYRVASLAGGGRPVAEMLGGRLVDPNTRDLAERRALNVVEEMALAAGCPVPPVYVLDREDGINAFAAGNDPSNAVIGLTRGAIDRLSRDELQGVIGHEFSHILNGDMKLDMRLMGVLFGILLISMVGWTIFRSTSGTRIQVRDGGREREGSNPLPLIGLGVYIVGYIGVIFARLIKAAVSRQREYLADASAVQFTRNPDGLVGALKKIGALSEGSHVAATRTEEASHLFFGEALGLSSWNPLASHPPLFDRIKRIDPTFDGDFSKVSVTGPRAQERDAAPGHKLPRWIGAKMGTGGMPLGVTDRTQFPFDPARSIATIGRPSPGDLALAAGVLDAIPDSTAALTQDPESARALIYGLLLDRDDPGVRQSQIGLLAQRWGPEQAETVNGLVESLDRLGSAARLPLVELALPALGRMSREQFRSFVESLRLLMEADRRISLFEYALRRLLMRALGPQYGWYTPPAATQRSPALLIEPASVVLSALARVGEPDGPGSDEAYRQGFAAMAWGDPPAVLDAEKTTLNQVDRALNLLAGAVPPLKRQFLLGCATCIGHDGQITLEEGQLLRAVADALDCPMPPQLPSGGSA
jgi:Zn-dependent protease with chaperone function